MEWHFQPAASWPLRSSRQLSEKDNQAATLSMKLMASHHAPAFGEHGKTVDASTTLPRPQDSAQMADKCLTASTGAQRGLSGETESVFDMKDVMSLLNHMLGEEDADPLAMEKHKAKCHERYLASLNTPERLTKHNAIMQQFTGDGSIPDPGPLMAAIMPDFNPLFSSMWEPWAGKVQYIGARDYFLACGEGKEAYDGWNLRTMAEYLFSWAVPTLPLLKFMVDNAPNRKIAEIGSGKGYWAALLSRMGADVVAVDDGSELGGAMPAYFPDTIIDDGVDFVQRGSADDRALFFCWARRGDMPARCIEAYKGDTVFFVGENESGMGTFDVEDWLYSEQGKEWKVEARKEVPAWIGLYDSFIMCKRVKEEERTLTEEEEEEEEEGANEVCV